MSQNPEADDLLPEYDFSGTVRGKYYERYREGTNVVLLDPDVAQAFKDSESVNRALRLLLGLAKREVFPGPVRHVLSEYEFSLVISGTVEEVAILDALFEAGCDDATFGQVDGVGYADFIREASSFAEAVRSAIEQVESIPGLRVVRVESDDLDPQTR
jgi:hypothetical protein